MVTYIVDFLDQNIPKYEETREGFLTFMATVARIGTQEYLNDNGKLQTVYRPEEEVSNVDSLASFANKPVTILHPEDGIVTPETAKKHQVGHTHSRAEYNRGFVQVGITLTDKKAIEAVKSGKLAQLSAGYTANLIKEPGTWENIQYDAKQTDITVNHVALVHQGRAGELCRVHLDSAITSDNELDSVLVSTTSNQGLDKNDYSSDVASYNHNSNDTPISDTINVSTDEKIKKIMAKEQELPQVIDDSAVRIENLKLQLDSANTKLDSANGKVAVLEATIADLNQELANLKSSTVAKEQIQELVKSRVKLESQSLQVLGDSYTSKINDLSDIDIMKEVITKRYGARINLAAKSDEYIKAVYDTVLMGMSSGWYDSTESNAPVTPSNNTTKYKVVDSTRLGTFDDSLGTTAQRSTQLSLDSVDESEQEIYRRAAERYSQNASAILSGNLQKLKRP